MNNEPKAGANLDPEMLAAYIDRRLTREQRAAVEAELAKDPDSYAVLVESLKTLDEMPMQPAVPAKQRRWPLVAAAVAIAAAIVIAVALPRLRGGVDPRFERLVAAVGDERYIEPRLSGGFKYGPLRSVNRGQQDTTNSNLLLLAAAGELQKAAVRDPSVESLHAWGVAQVLLGQYDGAIDTLIKAMGESKNRAIASDLAAAYIARAQSTDRAEDWPRALTEATRATEGENPPMEALFNRALAAEALNLVATAKRDWQTYLEFESRPEWRAEATSHLDRLNKQAPQSWRLQKQGVWDAAANGLDLSNFVGAFAQKIREGLEDELLPEWARQELADDSHAAQTLSIAIRLADALKARTGDDLLARSTHLVESFDRPTRALMASAVQQYAAGRELYERAAMQDSAGPFANAKQKFERAGVPLSEWCDLYLATARYYGGDYPSTLASLENQLKRVSHQPWFALSARIYWLRGLVATLRAEYNHSLDDYQSSLTLFERLGEAENQAAVHSLLATALLYVGDDEAMWSHSVRALQNRSADSTYRRQHMILTGAANRAARLDLPEAALAFADEASVVNQEWNDPIARIEIASYRARSLVKLGRHEQATKELASARQSINQVIDKGLRQRAEAELMQTEADVLSVADPRSGVEAASRAIEFFSNQKSVLRVPRLYGTRAIARRQLGDIDGAVSDLREGASRFDAERLTLPRSERLRLAYSDEVWDMYRKLLSSEIDRGAPCVEVLAAAERARGTTYGARDGLPSLESLDPKVAIVSFSFVDKRLATIVIRGGKCDLHLSDVTEPQAREAITAVRQQLTSPASTGVERSTSAELFQTLLAPIWQRVEGATELDVIADGPLHYLPFSALRLSDGAFLIERIAIRVIPNLNPRELRQNVTMRAVLSDGGTVSDSRLPHLPGASAEVADVAQLLRSEQMNTEEATTAESFLRDLHSATVVHFAGHAVANEQYPLLSRLVLGGITRDEWVTAEQIVGAGPIAADLVFLSACSTHGGRLFGGEGPASLARSFLAAGARDAVASLWPVPDGETAPMVTAFYRHWLRDRNAAQALRAAVLEIIHQGKPATQQWAAWTVIGRAMNNSSTGGKEETDR